ncbi:MAG: CRISPR-associated endonuclease Cas3'' [Thermoguttaceae bacterium]|nr:CRISPR-associated endonuclease Cas3'' [Thermoguttaceae bacterium]
MVKFPKKAASKLPPTLSLSSCLAKTCNENEPGCSVLEHLIYVGKIAEALWERLAPDVQTLLPRDVAVSLAALHDVGKIAPGFQVKIWQAVAEEKRSDEARRFLEATGESESAHAKIGCCVLRETALGDWAEVVGMHHGALNASFGEKAKAFYWQELREETIAKLTQIFGPLPTFSTDAPKPTREQIELAAGFIVVADWLGSDENFLVDGKVPDANEAEKRAVEILDSIGWTIPKPFDDKTFGELFDERFGKAANFGRRFEPNETQRAFHDVATEPGVFIVEAPTGTGKTEAALWGAYRLLRNRCCNGIYFALPTRTTSDKIHERFEPFLARACADSPVARLTHGTAWTRTAEKNDAASNEERSNASRWQTEEYAVETTFETERINERDERDGKRFFAEGDWFRPSKRALLQAFGVGTVDQALLSVLPQKHAFLRLFGLAGVSIF